MTTTQIDRLFKAFADETRLRILHLLIEKKELCVCDIIDILNMGQSKVSRHLAYLKNAGLVVDRKDGIWSYYSLAKTQSSAHKRILSCLNQCFGEVGILQKDSNRLKSSKSLRACCV